MMSRDRFPGQTAAKETDAQLESAMGAAKKCLTSVDFQKYVKQLDAKERELLDNIRFYKNPDPIEYAFLMQARIHDYNWVVWLREQVERDAGVINEKN